MDGHDEDACVTKHGVTRRQFLTGSTAAAAGCLLGCDKKSRKAKRPPPAPPGLKPVTGRSRVFMATHGHAVESGGRPAAEPVEAMLDHLMKELTGKSRPDDAWASLFRPDDVVGIKPNARAHRFCSPSPALMDVIIKKLRGVGVKPENILMWELGHFSDAQLYTHLKKGPAVMKLQGEWGIRPEVFLIPSGKMTRFNNAVHKATALINVAVFKDHGLAGVTGALKNLTLGSVETPRQHHANCCTPFVPELYNLPILREKVRLTLADVFRLIYNRGPTGPRSRNYNIPFGRLYASLDPVALDRVCWDVIDRVRKDKGMGLLMNRGRGPEKKGRPIHVLHAAKIGLGQADLGKIKIIKKKLG
jgi:uncharacterized protein (DUF362 family)